MRTWSARTATGWSYRTRRAVALRGYQKRAGKIHWALADASREGEANGDFLVHEPEQSTSESDFHTYFGTPREQFRIFSPGDQDPGDLEDLPTWEVVRSKSFINAFAGIPATQRLVRESAAVITTMKADRLKLVGVNINPGTPMVHGLVHVRTNHEGRTKNINLVNFARYLDGISSPSHLEYIQREFRPYIDRLDQINQSIATSRGSTADLMHLVGTRQSIMGFFGTLAMPSGLLDIIDNPIGFIENTAPLIGACLTELLSQPQTQANQESATQ